MTKEPKCEKETQSVPARKGYEQKTLQIETAKLANNINSEINVYNTDNQENRIQDDHYKPSE